MNVKRTREPEDNDGKKIHRYQISIGTRETRGKNMNVKMTSPSRHDVQQCAFGQDEG